MFLKHGDVDKVSEVWSEWRESIVGTMENTLHSKVLRGAVISALAMHGRADDAEEVFNTRPLSEKTDEIMLLSLLTAFSHAGLPDRAISLLNRVEPEQNLSVRVYTAVIDACARVGHFDVALGIVDRMRGRDVIPNDITWMTLLGPCRTHVNIPVAELAFRELQKVQDLEDQASTFILLADVYKAAELHDKAEEIQNKRRALGLHKKRGAVEVTVKGQQHTFYVGEIPTELEHLSKAINAKLDDWKRNLSACGVSSTSVTCRHSEKLALAFAVISGQKDITLKKNLRICSVCHCASIALTKIEGIVIRHLDQSRVHVMSDGMCSCGGRY